MKAVHALTFLASHGASKLRLLLLRNFSDTCAGLGSIKELRQKLGLHVKGLQQMEVDPTSPPVNQNDLVKRSVEDSKDRVVLPLGSQPELQLQYLTSVGNIRLGKILEDLDTFAVWLSYRHNQGLEKHGLPPAHHPMSIVTACVDRIAVHPLNIKTTVEEEMFRLGEEATQKRQQQATESLLKTAPSVEETKLQHELFLKTIDAKAHTFKHRVLPPNSVWLEDCKLKNMIICHPEQRNLYNKIFGGFLMRMAFELGWANARIFSRKTPKTLVVDDIMFRKSVEVGSLLFLSSEVCYTEGPYMQILVNAEVVNPDLGTQETTNLFNFTFSTMDNSTLPSVIPKTYSGNHFTLEQCFYAGTFSAI